MAPSGPEYHTDWIWCRGSNVHIANHRNWFTSFKKIKSRIANPCCCEPGGEPSTFAVRGIGDVELNVVSCEKRTGPKSQKKLVLKDVLYAPDILCNVLGKPMLKTHYRDSRSSKKRSWLDDKAGAGAIILDHPLLPRLRLVGMNSRETCLREAPCSLDWRWSDKERAKWTPPRAPGWFDLTPEQETWIKPNYETEWRCLFLHDLRIDGFAQRLEGRCLMKHLMHKEAEAKPSEDQEEADDGTDLDELFSDMVEEDPCAHFLDHYFSKTQLDLIRKHYGHSGNLIRTLGLKPWSPGSSERAMEAVRSMEAKTRVPITA
ncbi:uncharacterized protein RHO25_009035 [Cercospora beticola]|uniref:Retrovirus-related Pol polyprotein from transposon TNT 1-94-like beta-barrel domain-containing protein n=1 Tax=Cercospora beticola TaxID=122368 RepID=A0ABZ0NXR8_CERBT|nr:hypothetical protein RHO25_009035 [Cercospora beticola]CAK1356784.1 unnamed protein product [Cercospora beticola]